MLVKIIFYISLISSHLIHRQRFKLLFEDVNVVLIVVLNQELHLFDLYVGRKVSELGQEVQHLR